MTELSAPASIRTSTPESRIAGQVASMAHMPITQQLFELLPGGSGQDAQSQLELHELGHEPNIVLLPPEGLLRPTPWPLPGELLDELPIWPPASRAAVAS
jgi:hypothetical protein